MHEGDPKKWLPHLLRHTERYCGARYKEDEARHIDDGHVFPNAAEKNQC